MSQRLTRAKLVAWTLLAIAPVAGCGGRHGESLANLQALAQRVGEFQARHQTLPDTLDQLSEFFADEAEFQRTVLNPLTGDNPGYQYVKPPAGVMESSLAGRVVVLYQLRDGQRADDLPVGFAAGTSGHLQLDSITQTVAAWSELAAPEAGLSVMLPGKPASKTDDPAQWTYTVNFCGLQYTVLAVQSAMFRRVADQGDPQSMMRSLRDELIRQVGGRQTGSRPIELKGRPGLAAEIESPDKDSELQVRWYMAGDRLYCLTVSGPKGSLNSENAGVFFGSFKFASSP